jgi:hypothetical protein
MFIHDDYDDTYDVKRLQLLPMYQGMTEKEIRHLMAKIAALERQQWEAEVRAMLLDQRNKTMAYIEKTTLPLLPRESVIISHGVKITSQVIDDHGFVSEDTLRSSKRTWRLSLDNKKKIYL